MACRLSCPIAYSILVPQPGIEPLSPALEGGFFFFQFYFHLEDNYSIVVVSAIYQHESHTYTPLPLYLLGGKFLTTGPPRKSLMFSLLIKLHPLSFIVP